MKINQIIKMYESAIYSLVGIIFLITFVLIGATMNFLVMTSNGGRMPVLNQSYETNTHFGYWFPEQIKYSILADNHYLGNYIYSLGDLVMLVSVVCTLVCTYFFFKVMKGGLENV